MERKKINDEIKTFLENVFTCLKGKSFTNLSNFLNSIDLPWPINKQKEFCDNELGELFNALKSIPTNKSPEF